MIFAPEPIMAVPAISVQAVEPYLVAGIPTALVVGLMAVEYAFRRAASRGAPPVGAAR